MKHFSLFLTVFALASAARAQNIRRDIPFAGAQDEKQTLDVYAPADAKNLPVVFWIHGGGWQTGDKTDVKSKPQAFMDKGFVFVSTDYRLLPAVDMATLIRDVAASFRWVEDHIAGYGGDPRRVLVGGHSAGATLVVPNGGSGHETCGRCSHFQNFLPPPHRFSISVRVGTYTRSPGRSL